MLAAGSELLPCRSIYARLRRLKNEALDHQIRDLEAKLAANVADDFYELLGSDRRMQCIQKLVRGAT